MVYSNEIEFLTLTAEKYDQVVHERGSNLPSLGDLRYHEEISTSETLLHRIGAVTANGKLVGFGLAVSGPWDPIQQPGHFLLEIKVDPKWQKHGIGKAIFKILQALALDHGAVTLKACVRDNEPESLLWAERLGFVNEQHVFASRLDLFHFDLSKFSGFIDMAEMSEFTFTSLAAYPQNDEWFERLMDFYYQLLVDVPGVLKNHRPELMQLKMMFKESDNWEPEGIILAVNNDQWVAIAWVVRRSDNSYYNHMTGVHRSYRGRHLGMAVKLKSIEYAKNQDARYIYTHNDSNNRPILAINQTLGFKPTHGVYWLRKVM